MHNRDGYIIKGGQIMHYLCKKEVGKRIKELRIENNLTQAQLADKLYYATERQLQRIENGETLCSTDKLVEVAQILGTTTDYLLFGDELLEELKGRLKSNGINGKDIFLPLYDGLQLKINFVITEV